LVRRSNSTIEIRLNPGKLAGVLKDTFLQDGNAGIEGAIFGEFARSGRIGGEKVTLGRWGRETTDFRPGEQSPETRVRNAFGVEYRMRTMLSESDVRAFAPVISSKASFWLNSTGFGKSTQRRLMASI
jgi:hypothetical protein